MMKGTDIHMWYTTLSHWYLWSTRCHQLYFSSFFFSLVFLFVFSFYFSWIDSDSRNYTSQDGNKQRTIGWESDEERERKREKKRGRERGGEIFPVTRKVSTSKKSTKKLKNESKVNLMRCLLIYKSTSQIFSSFFSNFFVIPRKRNQFEDDQGSFLFLSHSFIFIHLPFSLSLEQTTAQWINQKQEREREREGIRETTWNMTRSRIWVNSNSAFSLLSYPIFPSHSFSSLPLRPCGTHLSISLFPYLSISFFLSPFFLSSLANSLTLV